MRSLDRIRHDQGYGKWLAKGGFSVTNLGNLDRIRHFQGLADGGFSVTNLGNLDRGRGRRRGRRGRRPPQSV